jgi:hypothetical protein
MVLKDDNSEKSIELFISIGLDEKTARNTINNNKVTANLTAVIHEVSSLSSSSSFFLCVGYRFLLYLMKLDTRGLSFSFSFEKVLLSINLLT